jgi:hypothetical protein
MSLTAWWHGRGQHRAADRISTLTAERDLWLMLALHQAAQLAYRDRQLTVANEQTERLAAQVEGLTIERDDAQHSWAQAAARLREAQGELANARTIRVAAPADLDDTVPIPMPTVIPLRFAFPQDNAA